MEYTTQDLDYLLGDTPEVDVEVEAQAPDIQKTAEVVASEEVSSIEAIQTEIKQPVVEAGKLFNNVVALNIKLSRLGVRRKLSQDQYDVEAQDRSLVTASKAILACEEYQAIVSLDQTIRKSVRAMCVPTPRSVIGQFVVSLNAVVRVSNMLSEFQNKRKQHVDAFIANYERIKEDARQRLDKIFNEDDYPPVDDVAESFKMEWQWLTFGQAVALTRLDKNFFEEERKRAKDIWTNAIADITEALRIEFKELCDNLVDRLSPDEAGNPKRFKSSFVQKFSEFIEAFDVRNVTDDAQLKALVEKARNIIERNSPDELRASPTTRAVVRQAFEAISNQIEALPAGRVVTFE